MAFSQASLALGTSSLLRNARYHLWTALLFTKSDIKTTVLPIAIFALGTTPKCQSVVTEAPTKPIAAILWLWTSLLHFNLINQTDFPAEDVRNKPWRPIPSNRISLENAVLAKWISAPVSALISVHFGGGPVLAIFVVYATFVVLYNCYGGAKIGWVKNIMTAFGLCCLALGTKLVYTGHSSCPASSSKFQTLHHTASPEFTILFFVIATTTHAQDFEDINGDLAIGRKTFPITHSELARIALPVILTAWSVGIVTCIIEPSVWLGAVYVGLAMVVGLRFAVMRRVEDDKRSGVLYSAWLGFTIALVCLY